MSYFLLISTRTAVPRGPLYYCGGGDGFGRHCELVKRRSKKKIIIIKSNKPVTGHFRV